jgi:hypothetical protein
MKTPRITDFDPDAKVPALKSPLDGMPAIRKPQPKSNGTSPPSLPKKPAIQEEQGKQAKQHGTPAIAPKPIANKRPVKPRHGFDIYWDQYEALLNWSNEEKLQGGTGSMSAMVREALDDYIAKRKNQ